MSATPTPPPFDVCDLGRLDYEGAFAAQRRAHAQLLAGAGRPTVFLVEHEPVITVSRRRSAAGNVLLSHQRLAELGIDVRPTDRGGDVTYHGPGQVVVYPILYLPALGLNVGGYMRLLEQAAINVAAQFGVAAFRDPPHTGVWVRAPAAGMPVPGAGDPATAAARPALAKLCAMGVRVSRGATLHGLAFNVDPNLSHFAAIIPCGLVGRGVTSLKAILGDASPGMDGVKSSLVKALASLISHCHSGSAGHARPGGSPGPGTPGCGCV